MNDNTGEDAAAGEPCGVCGGRIDPEEGRAITEHGEVIAYVHHGCA